MNFILNSLFWWGRRCTPSRSLWALKLIFRLSFSLSLSLFLRCLGQTSPYKKKNTWPRSTSSKTMEDISIVMPLLSKFVVHFSSQNIYLFSWNMFDELFTEFFALDDFTSRNLSFWPITIGTVDNFSGKIAIVFYIEISLLMSFLLHSLLLMTLLEIYTCNAFPIENHTDHQKGTN